MAGWKKVLTSADIATDGSTGVANGETGLVTGNAVYDYIAAQGFGTGAGDIESVVVTADDSNTVGASTGSANFTIAGGTGISTSATGSTLTVALNSDTITIGGTGVALGGTITALTALTDLDLTAANHTIFDTVGANTLTIGASTTTVTIAGDLVVSGSTTTINTQTLAVEDQLITLANVTTPTTTTAHQSGIQVESSATEAEWPELKWNNNTQLTGWTLSDHTTTSSTDFPVAVMQFGTAAPSSPAIETEAGEGAFFFDSTNDTLYVFTG